MFIQEHVPSYDFTTLFMSLQMESIERLKFKLNIH